MWSQVVGVIDINTWKFYNSREDLKRDVEKIMSNAPVLSSKRRKLDVFVNSYSYYKVIEVDENGKENNKYIRAAISVVGSLPDCYEFEVRQKWKKFYKYVEDNFFIRNSSLKVFED